MTEQPLKASDVMDSRFRPRGLAQWNCHCPGLLIAVLSLAFSQRAAAAATPDFEQEVAPILINHCIECHHRGKASGELNLSIVEGLRRGGDSGPAVNADKPETSPLIVRVDAGEMPPSDKGKEPLSDGDLAILRAWVSAGAEWPKNRELGLHEQAVHVDAARTFWAYQPIRRPPVPHTTLTDRGANPIDAFVGEKLVAADLVPGTLATPRQLLRRAWLDLIGLPPSLKEQDHFLANPTPETYELMVDQLLANRGYGERWARYWLDLVRYADSNGYERDGGKPNVWKYRDYVIQSLNNDKPYDRFVVEQLAGDELPDRSTETVIATGFHALGAWQDEVDPLESPQYRADELDDMLRTTSQTLLAVTIGCARCHNHKFDPISMVDYYSLSAILSPLKRPNIGREDHDLPAGTMAQVQAVRDRDQKIAELSRNRDELRSLNEQEWFESGRSKLPAEVIAALRTAPSKRDPQQVQLAVKHEDDWQAELAAALPEERRHKISEQEQTIQRLRQETPDLPRAYFLFEDTPTPPASYLLLSGRASNPGPMMPPAVPVVLTRTQPNITSTEISTSGRRLAFAHWVVDPANPLTARVIVNRVWQHHFGEGLVATPSDFGKIGARPTHPALLDWLADWFVHDAKWSLKKLHRLIMTSHTYQATSTANATLRERDPENKLLGRFPHRRLDVEAIRDSILAASGKLNPEMYGPAVFLPIPSSVIEAHTDKEASWHTSPEPAIFRRTIYAYVKRTLLVPMLEVLDLCDTTNSTEKRSITSIAPQALTLYNGDFVNQQAAFFADRILGEAGDNAESQIDRAFRLALCRLPSPTEKAALLKFLEDESRGLTSDSPTTARRSALIQVCRVIFNLNEFVYAE